MNSSALASISVVRILVRVSSLLLEELGYRGGERSDSAGRQVVDDVVALAAGADEACFGELLNGLGDA